MRLARGRSYAPITTPPPVETELNMIYGGSNDLSNNHFYAFNLAGFAMAQDPSDVANESLQEAVTVNENCTASLLSVGTDIGLAVGESATLTLRVNGASVSMSATIDENNSFNVSNQAGISLLAGDHIALLLTIVNHTNLNSISFALKLS